MDAEEVERQAIAEATEEGKRRLVEQAKMLLYFGCDLKKHMKLERQRLRYLAMPWWEKCCYYIINLDHFWRKLTMADVSEIEAQARQEVADELRGRAVRALKGKLKSLEDAKMVVKNLEREIEDLKASIADDSFAG